MANKTNEAASRDQQGMSRREPWRVPSPATVLDRFADEMDQVFYRNHELVVRADLPGMKKDDVSIEVTENAITIAGERHQEHETDREGVYRSERVYGSFYRTIPLPDGAITDQAKASFTDGVLEITMPAPPQSTRARRLEITEGAAPKK
jgi:HSP20 family molecular chaperone IbpA